MPKVSVIMPAYNAEKYIKEAIDSILSQTFQDFEFIILNDCSQDDTENIILSYQDDRIVYLRNEKNMGVAATLNRGLVVAKGEYIARMDSDDISLPDRLAKQAAYLDSHPDVAILGTALERFGEDIPAQLRSFSSDPQQMKIALFFSCGLAHPTIMMRAAVIQSLGGYDLAYEGLEDYELWCRVTRQHQVTALPEVLFRYRVHAGQVTRNPSEKYLSRMRSLKNRQLAELGIEPEEELAECYFRFCIGKRPENLQEVTAFCKLLEMVLEANQQTKVYDGKKLRGNFKNVAVSVALNLQNKDALELCNNQKLFSAFALCTEKIKRSLRH